MSNSLSSLQCALRTLRAPQAFTQNVLLATVKVDRYARLPSALGDLFVAFNQRGISSVSRARNAADFQKQFAAQFGRHAIAATKVPAAIRSAMSGDRKAVLGLKFDLHELSEFALRVLNKALAIPPGQVRPYGWIAAEIGAPKAARAVGSALARNPVPLLIPCHRVVRTDGTIGDYALGSQNKRRILESEGVGIAALSRQARAGVRFTGSDTTHIFCYPLCTHARRTAPKHHLEFKSARDARKNGMRPCKVCRPVCVV